MDDPLIVEAYYMGRWFSPSKGKTFDRFRPVSVPVLDYSTDDIVINGRPRYAEIGRAYNLESYPDDKWGVVNVEITDRKVDDETRDAWRLRDRAAYLEQERIRAAKRLAGENNMILHLDLYAIREQIRKSPAHKAAVLAAVIHELTR